MNAIAAGASMALRDYPGYRLARRLRDGEGLEEILAGKLRAFADWLSPPRDLSDIKSRLATKPNPSAQRKVTKLPEVRRIPESRPAVALPRTKAAPNVEKTGSVVRYTGEKKGEMQTLIRPTGRWVEYSALNPNLELSDEEADWLLWHCKDFVRDQSKNLS